MLKMSAFKTKKDYLRVIEKAAETSWVGILIANRDGEFVYSNKIYSELTGFDDEFLYSLTIDEIINHITMEKKSVTSMVIEAKEEVIMEQHLLPTNKIVVIKGVPIFDSDGEVAYVVSNVLDITNLQELQQELNIAKGKWEQTSREVMRLKQREEMRKEGRIIYKSKVMEDLMRLIDSIARTDATILILGESGTGKELFARRLHAKSDRSDKPFIAINCGAIPDTLLESELFGYEKGTFTGGNPNGKIGLLEGANGGVVFLDEIGDMPLALQTKLLRVLEERKVTRLGGYESRDIDVRFIAATNHDLFQRVREKEFREDLYYRLNVIPLKVPALRERSEDIEVLANYFLSLLNSKYDLSKTIDTRAMEILKRKKFEGNVRQLKNLIERAVLISHENILTEQIINKLYSDQDKMEWEYETSEIGFEGKPLAELLEEREKEILTYYLKKYDSTYKISKCLGSSQSTIFRKMKKYGLI